MSLKLPPKKGRCPSTSPRHKMFCFLRQKHNILTLLHRNSQDFSTFGAASAIKTCLFGRVATKVNAVNPKLPRFSIFAPCSHFIFLQFSHFYEISAFSLIFTNYLLFLQYLAIIEVFFDISLLSLFTTHNQQISQTKFSKVLCKILKSIYWMVDKMGSRFLASPYLTFNKLTN